MAIIKKLIKLSSDDLISLICEKYGLRESDAEFSCNMVAINEMSRDVEFESITITGTETPKTGEKLFDDNWRDHAKVGGIVDAEDKYIKEMQPDFDINEIKMNPVSTNALLKSSDDPNFGNIPSRFVYAKDLDKSQFTNE